MITAISSSISDNPAVRITKVVEKWWKLAMNAKKALNEKR